MTSENNNSVKESVGKLVYLLFGPAAKEAGDALGDYVRGVLYPWRMNNLEKIAAKAQARIGNAQTIPLPPKTAMEFVDAASMDDDEVLQVLWASLLARYLINGAEKRESFVEILRHLSPTEARIFKELYQFFRGIAPEMHPANALKKDAIKNKFGLSEDDYVIIHQNMMDVGIIAHPTTQTISGDVNDFAHLLRNDSVMMISKKGMLLGNYVIAPSLARGGGEPDKGAG